VIPEHDTLSIAEAIQLAGGIHVREAGIGRKKEPEVKDVTLLRLKADREVETRVISTDKANPQLKELLQNTDILYVGKRVVGHAGWRIIPGTTDFFF
jgi:hypothetical protein